MSRHEKRSNCEGIRKPQAAQNVARGIRLQKTSACLDRAGVPHPDESLHIGTNPTMGPQSLSPCGVTTTGLPAWKSTSFSLGNRQVSVHVFPTCGHLQILPDRERKLPRLGKYLHTSLGPPCHSAAWGSRATPSLASRYSARTPADWFSLELTDKVNGNAERFF